MRILHLAYEDPRQPGSGGGSVRTREVNRRLSARHEIVAIVAAYPGATERVEDGIHWVPIGPRTGGKLSRLAYFPLLGREIVRRPHDILVEDFGAPFSVAFSPLFTRRPVVASVQWLFASQMRDKYRLPFDWVESTGLRRYDDFIAVSGWLAARLRDRRPGARVEAIPNGVDPVAFDVTPEPPSHLLFVGRLDAHQKGTDLLLQIAARCASQLGEQMPPLLIVGDGPDRGTLEGQASALGLDRVVHFVGRREGRDKFQLMASAHAVLMPSRHETFGMVAVEAQAAGAPLIAFDVGPLREVAGPGGARLIPPFDVQSFADEVSRVVREAGRLADLRAQGRAWARRFDWDRIAELQEAHYRRALEYSRPGRAERRATSR